MMIALKMMLGKAWAWLLVGVTTILGSAVLFFRWSAERAQKKEAEAKAALEIKQRQVEGFEHAFEARTKAETAVKAAREKERARPPIDPKDRSDFSKPEF